MKEIIRSKTDNLTCCVILNWNGINDTRKCLDSLIELKIPHLKIIVVDNGSSNKEGDKLAQEYQKKVEVLKLPKNLGFSGGCNYGLEVARKHNPEFYLLLNNDVLVKDNFLNHLIKTASSCREIGLVAPIIKDYHNPKEIIFSGGGINWPFAKPYHRTKIKPQASEQFLTGCCLLIKKELVEKIGLLDDRFFAYFEDTSYCFKARRLGYRCVCDKQAVIFHKNNASSGKNSLFFTYLFSRNRILFVRHYFPKFLQPYYFLFFFSKLVFATFYFTVTKQQPRRSAFLKGYLDGTRDIGGIPRL